MLLMPTIVQHVSPSAEQENASPADPIVNVHIAERGTMAMQVKD